MDTCETFEYLGGLIVAKVSQNGQEIIIKSLEIESSGKFSRINEAKSVVPNDVSTVEFITGKPICFADLGLIMPSFLTVSKSKKQPNRILTIYSFVNEHLRTEKRMLLPSFFVDNLPHSPSTCFNEICLLNGPTVTLIDRSDLSIYICSHSNSLFLKVSLQQLCLPMMKGTYDNFSVQCVGHGDDAESSVCIFAVQSKTCKMEYEAFIISIDGFVERKDIKSSFIPSIPHKDYWPILTSFCAAKFTFEEEWTINDDVVWPAEKDILLFTTKNKQFLACAGYDTLVCCTIPFDDCYKIEITKLPSNEFVVLLTSKSCQCCVVSMKEKKVIKHWTEIQGAFVGDFCKKGHPQILVLFSNVDGDIDGIKYVLTDFYCCQKDSKSPADEKKENIAVQSSLSAVAKALSANLQATLFEAENVHALFESKRDLIQESWRNLVNMSLNIDKKCEVSKDLVPLFGNKMMPPPEAANCDSDTLYPPFTIVDQNQCILLDKWIVTVTLKSNLSRIIKNVNLHLLVENQVSQSTVLSKVCKEQNLDQLFSQSDSKINSSFASVKDIDTDLTFTLTAKTDVPFFGINQTAEGFLFVNWRDIDGEEDTASHSVCIGKCRLDAKNLSKEIFTNGELSTSKQIFQCIEIELVCQHGNLSSLPEKLKNALTPMKCEVILHDHSFDLGKVSSDVAGKLVIILSKSRMMAEKDIFARSSSEASIILSIVTSMLPVDCEVSLPLRKYEKMLHSFADSLSKELSVLDTMIRTAETNSTSIEAQMDDVEMKAGMSEQGSTKKASKEETIERIRNNFKRKRKRAELMMQNANCITINPEDYKRYLKALQETNSAAELLMMLSHKN